MTIKTHPLQKNTSSTPGKCPQIVTKQAYEVYSYIYGTSQSLERLCERGGFGTGEIIAFLYAYSFPKSEWSTRVEEAFKGMQGLG